MSYIPTSTGDHGRSEELQWARIVADPNPAKGVALIFIQKLCTAFHEAAPAWRAGALKPEALPYLRERLAARARRVLEVLSANNLERMDGVAELRGMIEAIESAGTMEALVELEEPVHALNHVLSDALEAEQ